MAGTQNDGESMNPGRVHDDRRILAGVEVREEDIEPQRGLHVTSAVFRVCAVIIFLLALWQFGAWWVDRPPGGVGIGVLVGDTIRLIVFAGLLWAAGDLASLWIQTHDDIRAGRILLARQTYMMRQWGIAKGGLPIIEPASDRRGVEPEATVVPPDGRS